jgi:septum formation protein
MLFEELISRKLILASGSPRRKLLLEGLGLDFSVLVRETSEDYPEYLRREEIALFLSRAKAQAILPELKDTDIIISADTIVCCEDKILNKPVDRADAISMLKLMSGKKHEVITGVCILSNKRENCFFSITEVLFALLDDDEISYYVDNYKPYDKAGAYGIQEWIGFIGIEHIEGSYFNVMGLPVQRLYTELKFFVIDN